jgi:hypothetical protein
MSELLTFINSFGTKVTFSSLGASIHDIQIKDRDGKIDSIVMRPYLARIEE